MMINQPAEMHMPSIGQAKFLDKLAKAFEFFELKRSENAIKHYGISSWNCFRMKPNEEMFYLSLEAVKSLAKKIGG